MSYYGTVLLARTKGLLVHLPEVRLGFGSDWRRLEERDGGWQVLDIGPPLPHQWPTVGGGPSGVARAAGSPVLAVWVSDVACIQIAASAADGRSWSHHLTRHTDGNCHDDHRYSTLRPAADDGAPPTDPQTVIGDLVGWAAAAGLDTTAERIAAASTDDRLYRDMAYALVDALGLPPGREIPPLFRQDEDEWWWTWQRGRMAGHRAGARWSCGSTVEADQARPEDEDLLRFVDQVTQSMYGGGRTYRELVREAARLTAMAQ